MVYLNIFYIPLVCVYRFHEIVRDPFTHEINRILFSSKICGKKAPRKNSNLNIPKYENLYGEPLCKKHKIFASDVNAFPK